MANHQSAIKEARKNQKRRLANRYYSQTVRTQIKKLRAMKDKKEAQELLPKLVAQLDKLAKRNIIHRNKASNLKSKLTKLVGKL